MPRPRDSPKCLPCQKPGFPGQPEDLDEVKPEADTPVLQDHSHVQSRMHSSRSGFASPTTSEYESEPSPTLKPQSIQPRSYKDDSRLAVSRSDLENCRQALRRTFRDCDKAEFRLVICFISCILNCARWLSRREILAAATLFDPDRISKKPVSVNQWSQEELWIRKCDPIIMETPQGNMTFRFGAMRFFLRSFRIHGVDTSHRTLALICRSQMEFHKRFARDMTNLNDRLGIFRATQVLTPYVAEFGHHHLRAATLTSIIAIAEEDRVLPRARHGASEACDKFEIIQKGTNQLSLSEEDDDWVLLTATPAMTSSSLVHHQTQMA